MANEIGTLASGIFVSEFDSNTGIASISSISGWLQHNIGLLNTYLYSDFSGTDPGFEDEENAIFTQLYLAEYYKKLSRNALRGVVEDTNSLVEVTEGDTTVRFANKGEIGKTYRGLSRDAYSEAERLIHSYNMYEAKPRQVVGYEGTTGNNAIGY
jgi:hypothetical protein